MTREVKEYDERRTEILNTARGLFFTKGYDQTSVNDLITAIGIAKGTFYHYFDSKEDLMMALAEQITAEGVAIIADLADDPELSPGEKLQEVFSRTGNWKVENMEMMLELLHVMYDPKNIRLKETIATLSIEKATPHIAKILKQGVDEGVFEIEYPEEIAGIIFHMGYWLSDQFGRGFLRMEEADESRKSEILEKLYHQIRVYEYAITRLVGMETEEFTLFDVDILKAFSEEM